MAIPQPIGGNQSYTEVRNLAPQLPELNVGGNLTVGGSINPGTFTNRVVTLVDAGAAAEITGGPLTAAQSGNTILVPPLTGAGQTLTLPPAAPGLNYKLVLTGTLAQVLTVTCDATVAERLAGLLIQGPGTTNKASFATLAVAGGGIVGDQVSLEAVGAGAGVVWQVVAIAGAATPFT